MPDFWYFVAINIFSLRFLSPTSTAFCLVFGYFIGSIPAGFLLFRWKRNIDLRGVGSGNVGAMNAFEVSGSRHLGAAVLLLDTLKGVCAVVLVRKFVADEFLQVMAATTGAMIGHNYPVWLRGKGGRGLATGAGALIVSGWIIAAAWILLWATVHRASRNIHTANIVASFLTPVIVALLRGSFIESVLPFHASHAEWIYAAIVINCIILLRHIGPAQELWFSFTNKNQIGS